MSDRALVVTALVVAAAAWQGIPAPRQILLAVIVTAVVLRHPLVVVLAVVLAVGVRSTEQRAALDEPLPDRVAGGAELVSDPRPGRFGTSVELHVAGRRFQAQVPRSDEWVLRPLMSGDHVVVEGRTSRFRGAPEGWRVSRHLAGRIAVSGLRRGPPAEVWFRAANWVHRTLSAGASSFDPDARALFLGLVVGDDRDQSDLERYRFRATGLGHLLAVSGQNVAFVMLLAGPIMRRLGLRSRWILGLCVLAAFVVLTRGEASVLRAAMMAAVGLAVGGAGRFASGARVMSLAVLGLCVVDPLIVDGLGFQLSVCATVGMIVGARPIAGLLRGPGPLVDAAACTLAAQAATAPLLLGLNGGVPSVATIANVLAVPAAGLVMVLGLTVGVLAGTVAAPVAVVLNQPARLLVVWISQVAANGSRLPFPLLGPDRLVLLAVSIGTVLLRRGPGRSRAVTTLLVAPLVAMALWPVRPPAGVAVLGRGVVVRESRCHDRAVRVVELGAAGDVIATLAVLQRAGIVRADLVSGKPDDATAMVADQLGAVVVEEGSPTCRVR